MFQIEVWKLQEYFVYPQGACRIRKAAKPPTAAQYFKIFKPISWGERPAERRSRFIQRFPNFLRGLHSYNPHFETVPISGRQLRFRRWLSRNSAGYCEIAPQGHFLALRAQGATAPLGPRNDNSKPLHVRRCRSTTCDCQRRLLPVKGTPHP